MASDAIRHDTCCFCSEMARGQLPENFASASGLHNRGIAESRHFMAIPSISPIAPGHVLIIPKSHLTSLAQTPPSHRDEFVSFVEMLGERIKCQWGPTAFFEHGVGECRTGGCGVDHAHLHILPMDQGDFSNVLGRILDDHALSPSRNLLDTLSELSSSRSYLVIGHSLEELRH